PAGSWCYKDQQCGKRIHPSPTWAALGHCNGTRQSPINIVTPDTVHNPDLETVSLAGYGDAKKLISMENTGKTADGLHLCAQGLPATYTAKSFHLHWSQGSDKPGSEHFINHKGFSMELHIVHTKNNLSMDDARKDHEGIAVLAFFLQDSCVLSPTLGGAELGPHSPSAPPGKKTNLDSSFSLQELLGSVDLARYYRYPGSLTTPNCDEVVVWTVFPDPILVPLDVVSVGVGEREGVRTPGFYPQLWEGSGVVSSGLQKGGWESGLLVAPSSSSTLRPAALIPLLISTAVITWHL
uniref:Carbonic anhydrase n=1 Tax=Chrysemys picta bellii TaxID=8478 RepID=A0A8C3P6A9_CHRPI